jgi:hypothetical protein
VRYNGGCAFVLEPEGIFIRAKSRAAPVPSGAIAVQKDQFACSQGSCRIVAVLFDVDCLVHVIQTFLNDCGARAKKCSGSEAEGGGARNGKAKIGKESRSHDGGKCRERRNG